MRPVCFLAESSRAHTARTFAMYSTPAKVKRSGRAKQDQQSHRCEQFHSALMITFIMKILKSDIPGTAADPTREISPATTIDIDPQSTSSRNAR